MNHRDTEAQRNALTEDIIGAAIEVHRHLGPGLLESAYEQCLTMELKSKGLDFAQQKALPIVYKGQPLDLCYRLDIVVADQVVLELKSVDKLLPLHDAQLLTYMRMGAYPLGLLLNFNAPTMKQGIRRLAL